MIDFRTSIPDAWLSPKLKKNRSLARLGPIARTGEFGVPMAPMQVQNQPALMLHRLFYGMGQQWALIRVSDITVVLTYTTTFLPLKLLSRSPSSYPRTSLSSKSDKAKSSTWLSMAWTPSLWDHTPIQG